METRTPIKCILGIGIAYLFCGLALFGTTTIQMVRDAAFGAPLDVTGICVEMVIGLVIVLVSAHGISHFIRELEHQQW